MKIEIEIHICSPESKSLRELGFKGDNFFLKVDEKGSEKVKNYIDSF